MSLAPRYQLSGALQAATGAGTFTLSSNPPASLAATLIPLVAAQAEGSGPPIPDFQDLSGPDFWYFGWSSVSGGWLVQEHRRFDARTRSVREGYESFEAAWAARQNLQYS